MAKRFAQNAQKSAPTAAKVPPTSSPEMLALPKPPAAPSSEVCANSGVTEETVAAKAKTPSLRPTELIMACPPLVPHNAQAEGRMAHADHEAFSREASRGELLHSHVVKIR